MRRWWIIFSISVFACCPALANDVDAEISQLLDLSLHDMTNVKVTSVSKKAEKLFEAEAAIYVISNDDIKESGATTIAEALRLAPGVQVAQAGASRWSVSTRGFNDQFANKLLVLMDGRTIYNSMYSGVYWDQQDTILEDIDRIEVIRGPGATLWGANAVNGVINIITKKAADTQGTMISAGSGNKERGFVNVRVGKKSSDGSLNYRVYGKRFDREGLEDLNGASVNDDWDGGQGGFRIDKSFSNEDSLTVHGNAYGNRENVKLKIPTTVAPFYFNRNDDEETAGGNILARWSHIFDDSSEGTLQTYYDIMNRSGYPTSSQEVKTFDTDWQHILRPSERHEVTWGMGYRNVASSFDNAAHLFFTPASRNQHFFNMFIQDKIALKPSKWYLTVGSKFEHNPFTGYEYQPSIRTSYLLSEKQTIWSSVSRAVRIPNRTINDISFVAAGTPGGLFRLVGNRNAQSEELIAYETGYRIAPTESVFIDLTAFYNDYDKLSSNETVTALSARSGNAGSGRSYGIESVLSWEVTKEWDIDVTQSFMNLQLDKGIESGVNSEGKSPRHQWGLRSSLDLPHSLQMNNQIYYTSALPDFNIKGYLRLDSNLVWYANKNLEFSVIGQNLLDDSHREFGSFLNETTEAVSRSFYAKVKLSF